MIAILLLAVAVSTCHAEHPFSRAFIDKINSAQTQWKAGMNFRPGSDIMSVKRLLGVLPDSEDHLPPRRRPLSLLVTHPLLPRAFDARVAWPECPTIGQIKDQGTCGAAWAISATQAMSDRVCIASGGRLKVQLSAQDLVECCDGCQDGGCQGGWPAAAWNHWVSRGLVTGSDNTTAGCKPYISSSCELIKNGFRISSPVSSGCMKKCSASYGKQYHQDLHYGASWYEIENNEKAIMREIHDHGPVTATMKVYQDLAQHKSGVYHHSSGIYVGDHAVRLIGWGEEAGTPYWLVANSWGTAWSNRGFAKILRGLNHCHIESGITAGKPSL